MKSREPPIKRRNKKNTINKGCLFKIDEYASMPVFASMNCYVMARLDIPDRRQHLIFKALRAFHGKDTNHGCCRDLRYIVGGNPKYQSVWAVKIDYSIALMFPEDF